MEYERMRSLLQTLSGDAIAVDVDAATDSIVAVREKVGMMPPEFQLTFNGQPVGSWDQLSQVGITSESTLRVIVPGRGGMSAAASSPPRRAPGCNGRDGSPLTAPIDVAWCDLSHLRRCMHRIHRFSPGVAGRAILMMQGDAAARLCASSGHWSLLTGRHVPSDSLSVSALHAACRDGRRDALDFLVERNALEVSDKEIGGWTPLHTAMVHNHPDVVRGLLDLGAVNVPTTDGVWASALRPNVWNHVGVAQDDTAPSPCPGRDAWEPPSTAEEAVSRLGEMIRDDSVSTETLCCRVCAAVQTLGPSVLDTVVPEKQVIRNSLPQFWAILHAAAAVCRVSLTRVCLELGAPAQQVVSTSSSIVTTPMLAALGSGSIECVRLLLDFGVPVTTGLTNFGPPIVVACWCGHVECVRLLLDRGARVDSVNIMRVTPLHAACMSLTPEVALLVLEHGADPSVEDGHLNTPAALARQYSQWDYRFAEAMEMVARDREAGMQQLRRLIRGDTQPHSVTME